MTLCCRCSPVLVGLTSGWNARASGWSARSRSMSSVNGCWRGIGRRCRDMVTSKQPSSGGWEQPGLPLTWSPAASLASPSPRLGCATVLATRVGDGRGCATSFARYDRASLSWRTSQLSFMTPTPSDGCSVTWPPSGSMRTGQCYQRAPWVHHTHVSGCSWWPTPTAAMGKRGWGLGRSERGRYRVSTRERVHGEMRSLGHWRPPVLMIERLMGLPDGWLRPAETLSSPRSPSTSDG